MGGVARAFLCAKRGFSDLFSSDCWERGDFVEVRVPGERES